MKYIVWFTALLTLANAQIHKTMCYMENWTSPSTIEKVKLSGGICKGERSIEDLQKAGWEIDDIITSETNNGVNYMYIMQKDVKNVTVKNVIQQSKSLIPTNKRKAMKFKPQYTKIYNTKGKTAVIDQGDLIVGQSGVIIHKYHDKHSVIIANASVIKSSENSSIIQFSNFNGLSQTALPTANIKASDGDVFVLNYLYDSSLLITPNNQSFKTARAIYVDQNFVHSDSFATNLKLLQKSTPTKPIIQAYCKNQNIGTIYFVIENSVYIVDAKTFKVLAKDNIYYEQSNTQIPFYTRVEDIKDGVFSLNFISWTDDRMKDYSNYYNKLLGL